MHDLESFALGKLCSTRQEFEVIRSKDPDALIVLKVWDHVYEEHQTQADGSVEIVPVTNKAFAFTSPALFSNIPLAIEGKIGGLNVLADGTFKLTSTGWVLIDIGTSRVW